MDKIKKYPSIPFGELNYAQDPGILYQREIKPFEYGKKYYENYVKLEGKLIGIEITEARIDISHRYADCILDVGIGSGYFIKKSKAKMFGFDINPFGIEWLKERGCFINPYEELPDCVNGVSLWDTLEHMPNPSQFLGLLNLNTFVFLSLPIFHNLLKVRKSKHYKPNEHLTYWSVNGIRKYMEDCGFNLLEISDQESEAGREDILSFVFKKVALK